MRLYRRILAVLVGLTSLSEATKLAVDEQGWRDAFTVGHYGAAIGALAVPLIGFVIALVLWPERRVKKD